MKALILFAAVPLMASQITISDVTFSQSEIGGATLPGSTNMRMVNTDYGLDELVGFSLYGFDAGLDPSTNVWQASAGQEIDIHLGFDVADGFAQLLTIDDYGTGQTNVGLTDPGEHWDLNIQVIGGSGQENLEGAYVVVSTATPEPNTAVMIIISLALSGVVLIVISRIGGGYGDH